MTRRAGFDRAVSRSVGTFYRWGRVLIAAATLGSVLAAPVPAQGLLRVSSGVAADGDRPDLGSPSGNAASPYVRHLAQLINEYRGYNGLRPLDLAPDLSALASEHSAKMAEYRRLSHDGFRDRLDRTSARLCVENVGMNFQDPETELDGWRASPGHNRNLLEPKVTRMGIAMSRTFVTFFACS